MTQNPSLNKTARSPRVTVRYMLATCRRGWALCLFIAVAFLLIYTVPALISLQEIAENRDYSIAHGYGLTSDVLKYADEQAKELADMMSQGAVIVSMIAAVFAGCYSLLFLQNKTSSAFYHSLPERRSGHFITALFTAFSTYLAAFLINFIISAITFAAYGLMFPELFAGLLAGFATAVFFFAAMLSVTFLAGTLTGNLVMHVIVTGIFTFILPVLFASVILLLSQGAEYFQPSSLYSELLLSLMSPFIAGFRAAFADETTSLLIFSYIETAILTVGTFVLSYVAYKKRPIEKSGSSVVYRRVGEAIKYAVMAPSAIMLGYLFSIISGSYAWGIFGFAAGLLLSFMLCNTALNRTAKAMFRGLRGLCIYAVILAAVSIVFATGIFGVVDYTVPSSADSIYISVSDMPVNVSTDKKDEVDALIKEIKQVVSMYSKDKDARDPGERYVFISVKYDKTLASLRYWYDGVPYKYAQRLIDLIYEIGDFDLSEANSTVVNRVWLSDIVLPGSFVLENAEDVESITGISNSSLAGNKFLMSYEAVGCEELSSEILAILNYGKPTSDPSIGWLYVYYSAPEDDISFDHNYYHDTVLCPVTYPQLMELLKLLYDNGYFKDEGKEDGLINIDCEGFISDLYTTVSMKADSLLSLSYEDYIRGLASGISKIVVYNNGENEMTFTDKNDIIRILPSLASIDTRAYTDMTVRTDCDYSVYVYVNGEGGNIINTDYGYGDEPVKYYRDSTVLLTWFLDGKVPDIVK